MVSEGRRHGDPGASRGESCTGTDEAGAPADRVKTTPREAPPLHLCRRERALLDALGRSVDLHRPLVLVAGRAVGWLDARTRAPPLARLREGKAMSTPTDVVNRPAGVSVIEPEPFAPPDPGTAVVRAEHLTQAVRRSPRGRRSVALRSSAGR